MIPDEKKKSVFTIFRGKWIAAVSMALGILILLLGNLLPEEHTEPEETYSVQYYTEMLENRIQNLCTSVYGVTEATVLLTLENGSEYVYAQNTEANTAGSKTWDYVIVSRGEGEEAVLVTEIYPSVRGVAVVCTGGDSAGVQQVITELLSASLGISSNRIRVAGR